MERQKIGRAKRTIVTAKLPHERLKQRNVWLAGWVALLLCTLLSVGAARIAGSATSYARMHSVGGALLTTEGQPSSEICNAWDEYWLLILAWHRHLVPGTSRPLGKKKKTWRTKEEIDAEQAQTLQEAIDEVNRIAALFHEQLPREKAKAIGAMYCRFSSRYQTSVPDQVRSIFELAVKEEIFIPREMIFFDLAVRGFKDRRPGLLALREVLESKLVEILCVFSPNRLYRRGYKSQQFIEEVVVDRGLHAIFYNPRLSTKDPNWRTIYSALAMADETQVRSQAAHVRAGHEGLFQQGYVCTTLPLGYKGQVVPGEFTKQKRPRRKIVVNPEAAPWITKIFEWYVDSGMSMSQIARLLNDDDNAPVPVKTSTGFWTPRHVRNALSNPCYVGTWCYGVSEYRWNAKKDYAEQVRREVPLKTVQFEHLRILSQDKFAQAQALLAQERPNGGRKTKGGGESASRFLSGLFRCPEHGRQLVAAGPGGRSLVCPLCRAIVREKRPLYTYLNRQQALRLTCGKLATLILDDDELMAQVISACQSEIAAAQLPDPTRIALLQSKLDKLDGVIAFNRRNPGESENEQVKTERLLRELRGQRSQLQAELTALEAAKAKLIEPPNHGQVRDHLQRMAKILSLANSSTNSENSRVARRVVDGLTGGTVKLYQMGERQAQRGWLQGRFQCDLIGVLVEQLIGVKPHEDLNPLEVTIDYREAAPIVAESERAKSLYDKKMMNAVIATKMGCSRSRLTKILKYWFESRNLEMPDGRSRRSQLERKHLTPPLYQRIADDVMQLYNGNLPLRQIAQQLGCDINTITTSVRWWHQSHDLAVSDGRTRRKLLSNTAVKNGSPSNMSKESSDTHAVD